MNKKMLMQLLIDEKQESNIETKSRLQDINENFVYLMMVLAIHIIGTLVIRIVMLCIPADFCILSNLLISNICAALLIFAYYNFTGIILWRIISFIASIYHLFNIYAVTRLLEILDEKDDKRN